MDLDFEVKNGGVDMCEALERRYSKERQTAKDQMIKKLLQNGVDESIIADSANVTVEYVVNTASRPDPGAFLYFSQNPIPSRSREPSI